MVPSNADGRKRQGSHTRRDAHALGAVLIDRILHPALVLDARTRILVLNEAMAELLGGTRDDLADRPLVDLVVDAKLGATVTMLDRLIGGRDERERLRISPRAHPLLTVELELERVATDGEPLLFAVASPNDAPPVEAIVVEVSMSPEKWGRLLRQPDAPSAGVGDVPECCRVVCGRTEACDECPAELVSPRNLVSSRVVEVQGRGERYVVITARHLGHERVAMSRLLIDEPTRSRLSEARLDAVSASAGLSKRERQVLSHLLLGFDVRAIAEILGITVRTVRFHQYNLLEKLGADSRDDLVRLVL